MLIVIQFYFSLACLQFLFQSLHLFVWLLCNESNLLLIMVDYGCVRVILLLNTKGRWKLVGLQLANSQLAFGNEMRKNQL